jgi:hypothetical protein
VATFNLVINYPDGQQARILAAIKQRFSTINRSTGAVVLPTNEQALEKLRLEAVRMVREMVLQEESVTAARAAQAGVTPIDAS